MYYIIVILIENINVFILKTDWTEIMENIVFYKYKMVDLLGWQIRWNILIK